MFPAAFVLPLWLLVGWGVFQASGWAIIWTLFLGMPAVFFGQLILTFLVRSRPTVRITRAVSWWDVLAFGAWHALIIALGFYPAESFGLLFAGAVLVGLSVVALTFWQLVREGQGAMRASSLRWSSVQAGASEFSGATRSPFESEPTPVIVVKETGSDKTTR